MTLKEIYQKKGEAVARCRELNDKVLAEKRSFTAEEQQQYEAWEKEIEGWNEKAETIKADQNRQTRLAQYEAELRDPVFPAQIQRAGSDQRELVADRRSVAERLREMSLDGMNRREALKAIATEQNDYTRQRRQVWNAYLSNGIRDAAGLQMDVDATGGFLVAPEQFVARLIQDMDNLVFMRQLATVIPLVGAESLGVPTLDTDISDTNWTTELAIGTTDTSMLFGKRRLTPHPLAKPIKVSEDLMNSAAISPESIVRERMAYKFGTVQETAFLTGNGAGQPLGVFTASASGISTARDSSTGNTTTAITADGLIECKYSLTGVWQSSPNLRWIFHRTAVKNIRKLKDGDGQYLWQPGLTADRGDRILDVPVLMSEYAPSTFTTGLYVGIIGDFSYYWIADAMGMSIKRLNELYAATNEIGFHGRMKLDGMPVLENAFSRLKLA